MKKTPPFKRVHLRGEDLGARKGAAFSLTPTANSVTIRSAPSGSVAPKRLVGDPATTLEWVPSSADPTRTVGTGDAQPAAVVAPVAIEPPSAPIVSGAAPFRVGPYEVAMRIARGAMGSAYVCRKTDGPEGGRPFTLKVIRQHSVKQELATASFRHEALIGSLFRHPNAQTAIDGGDYEGQPYLILDYVDGLCLADALTEETRPPPAVTVAIILGVLAALQALHRVVDSDGQRLGLIHCDVSPENILVGIDGVARLADFGSARITAKSNRPQAFALSKPAYMPPEQFRGDKLDSRSDLYSVGVVLWTALTGQQPFSAETYDETAINVMRKRVKPLSAFGGPACLDDVCAQAMSRAPDGRFVVANAMATALRSAAAAEGLIESREGVGQWVRRAMGDELTERQRRVDAVFGTKEQHGSSWLRKSPQPWPQPADSRNAVSSAPATQIFTHEPAPAPPPAAVPAEDSLRVNTRLSGRQRAIIAAASALTVAVAVAIGMAISSPTSAGTRIRRDPTAALSNPPAPVGAAPINADPR